MRWFWSVLTTKISNIFGVRELGLSWTTLWRELIFLPISGVSNHFICIISHWAALLNASNLLPFTFPAVSSYFTSTVEVDLAETFSSLVPITVLLLFL